MTTFKIKTLLLIPAILIVSGCGSLQVLTGNTGGFELSCYQGDQVVTLNEGTENEVQALAKGQNFTYSSESGTGRNTRGPIKICGGEIPEIEQGQDRSPGLLGVLFQFIGL